MVLRKLHPMLLLALVESFVPGRAAAEPPRLSEAATVYDAAARLYAAGRYDRAALLFARADELAVNDVALAQALQSCVLAGDASLGMALVERAARAAPETALSAARDKARRTFEHRVGRVTVRCPEPDACTLDIDGVPLEDVRRGYVSVGEHVAALHFRKHVEQRPVGVEAGATIELSPQEDAPRPRTDEVAPAPASPPPAAAPATQPVPTWPFWTAAAATVLLGAASTISMIDLAAQHDAFVRQPDDARASSGRSAQTRTDLLFAATGLGVVATTILAVVVFRTPPASGAARTGVLASF